MTWYRKMADALPATIDEVSQYGDHTSLYEIDSRLSPEQAERVSKSHPFLKCLGKGCQGVVYQFGHESSPGDPLTKLTISSDEFKNVQKILELQNKYGGQVPGVVYIFYSEKIVDKPFAGVYQIYTEHVRHLDRDESKAVAMMCSFALGLDTQKTEELITQIYEYVDNYLNYPLYISTVGKFLRLVANLKKIDPRGGKEWFWDLQDFNIGVNNNGQYVLLDIGRMKF